MAVGVSQEYGFGRRAAAVILIVVSVTPDHRRAFQRNAAKQAHDIRKGDHIQGQIGGHRAFDAGAHMADRNARIGAELALVIDDRLDRAGRADNEGGARALTAGLEPEAPRGQGIKGRVAPIARSIAGQHDAVAALGADDKSSLVEGRKDHDAVGAFQHFLEFRDVIAPLESLDRGLGARHQRRGVDPELGLRCFARAGV